MHAADIHLNGTLQGWIEGGRGVCLSFTIGGVLVNKLFCSVLYKIRRDRFTHSSNFLKHYIFQVLLTVLGMNSPTLLSHQSMKQAFSPLAIQLICS